LAWRRLLSSKCGWRLPVYGLILFIAGLIAGYALGYRQGWESALHALGQGG
jgi:hypothetical protein